MPTPSRAPTRPRPKLPPSRSRLLRPAAGTSATTLTLDASSPAIVYNAGATTTTASFTPPANSLIVVASALNNTNLANTAAPTITDSLGAHLTFTLRQHSVRPDAAVNGQAAIWTAPVVTSAAMTVSVTNADASTGQSVKVWVFTDTSGGIPLPGVSKKGAIAGASTSFSDSMTATATGSRGVLVFDDWTASATLPTAGAGCTLTGGGAQNQSGVITYAFMLRALADGVSGSPITMGMTNGSTATTRWAMLEVCPATGSAITEDPSAPLAVTGTGTTATTASFTPLANSLLVATASGGGGAAVQTCPVTDSLGSTWTLLKRANTNNFAGVTEVWVLDAGATPAARTATATLTGSTGAGVALNVKVLSGAKAAASCLGGFTVVNTTTAYSVSITTTAVNSLACASLVDSTGSGALTPNAITTAWQSVSDTTNGHKYAAFRATSLTGTPGATVIGFTNGAGNNQAIVAVEILASTGGTDATVTASTVSPAAAVIGGTGQAGAVVTATTVSSTAVIAASAFTPANPPTVTGTTTISAVGQAGAKPVPAMVAGTTTISAVVSAGSTVLAATVAPAAAVIAGSAFTPAQPPTVAGTTVISAVAQAGAKPLPATVAGTATISATAAAGAVVVAVTVSSTATISAVASAGATVSASTVAPVAAVIAGSPVGTIQAVTVAGTAIISATAQAGSVVVPATVAGTTTISAAGSVGKTVTASTVSPVAAVISAVASAASTVVATTVVRTVVIGPHAGSASSGPNNPATVLGSTVVGTTISTGSTVLASTVAPAAAVIAAFAGGATIVNAATVAGTTVISATATGSALVIAVTVARTVVIGPHAASVSKTVVTSTVACSTTIGTPVLTSAALVSAVAVTSTAVIGTPVVRASALVTVGTVLGVALAITIVTASQVIEGDHATVTGVASTSSQGGTGPAAGVTGDVGHASISGTTILAGVS